MDGGQLQRMAAALAPACNYWKKPHFNDAYCKKTGSEGEPVEYSYGTFVQNNNYNPGIIFII